MRAELLAAMNGSLPWGSILDGSEGWAKAEQGKRAILWALRGSKALVAADGDNVQTWAVELHTGARVLVASPRSVRPDWAATGEAAVNALSRCSTCWGVHRSGDKYGAHPYGCNASLCPVCARSKASKRARKWLPTFAALQSEGYTLVHLTYTQLHRGNVTPEIPLPMGGTVRVTPINGRGPGVGPSSWGAPLGNEADRLTASWRAMRNNTSNRPWWRRTVAGYVYGMEATGQSSKVVDGKRIPWGPRRWHVHGHALVLLAPEVDPAEWASEWGARWARCSPGAIPQTDPDGDRCCWRVVDGSEGSVNTAVLEVLKYPGKLASMVPSQVVEWMATAKGRHWHQAGGCLHASSTVGRSVRALQRGEVLDGVSSSDQELATLLASVVDESEPAERMFRAYEAQDGVHLPENAGADGVRNVGDKTHLPASGAVLDGGWWVPVTVQETVSATMSGSAWEVRFDSSAPGEAACLGPPEVVWPSDVLSSVLPAAPAGATPATALATR